MILKKKKLAKAFTKEDEQVIFWRANDIIMYTLKGGLGKYRRCEWGWARFVSGKRVRVV